ncbi:MAG TPA: alpha-D-ribose 1-methylphosphonate 5-triphosphate diphosphatase [Vicinamibacterales bacterium]|nr:alpha-D-ribose 1-methylphosphonate 5-triphosphate diphosphatase [Vicinamibacterales bacterium]
MSHQILTNATLVLPERTVRGTVVIEGDRIAEVSTARYADGLDLDGQFLIPGLIDIHTDYMEKELNPRPSTNFPLEMAFHFMDVRAIACGLTTVLGAARISDDEDGRTRVSTWRGDGVALAKAYRDLSRTALARHFIHLRWNPNFEPVDEILQEILGLESIGNLVYNDAVPGERQFRHVNEERIQAFAAKHGLAIDEARVKWEERREALRRINTRPKVNAALAGRVPLGSHDDTTVEHVEEAHAWGATLCEMPCTIEAARRAKALGMMVCMGAPNYFRGSSHCGNLSCRDAMAEGLVDILCSDFHFPSMLGSVVMMMCEGMEPSAAVRMVTLNAARHLRRERELGSIEEGRKADLVAFSPRETFGAVSRVWVDGTVRFQSSGPNGQQNIADADRAEESVVT